MFRNDPDPPRDKTLWFVLGVTALQLLLLVLFFINIALSTPPGLAAPRPVLSPQAGDPPRRAYTATVYLLNAGGKAPIPVVAWPDGAPPFGPAGGRLLTEWDPLEHTVTISLPEAP